MVRFDRSIPPGGEGSITLKINTRGYGGPIKKSASIFTNDPANARKVITIKAFVKIPIDISPRRADLVGYEGQEITRTVKITAMEETPLRIELISFDLDGKVKYLIETLETERVYRISFKNIPGPAATFRGTLRLKTNYPKKPEIVIPVRAKFRKKIVRKSPGQAESPSPKNPKP